MSLIQKPVQNGSPIFMLDEENRRIVVGIHVYGGDSTNTGIRVNNEVFDLFSSWIR